MSQDQQFHEVAEKIWRSFHTNRLPSPDCTVTNPAWRSDRLDAIDQVVGRTRQRRQRLLRFLGSNFGATKLAELSNAQLDFAWREISTWQP